VGFFEIGTNNPGEISKLANILKMNLSIITNIGNAHLEGLKNIDGVANEKSDIFVFTKDEGYCLGDIPKKYLNLVRDKSSGKNRIFISDNDPKKLMKIAIMQINDLLKLEYLPKEVDSFLDKKIDVPGRFEIKKSKSKALIIDDSYNANPDSFSYAFKTIKNLDLTKISLSEKGLKYQKKICVMGKMGELGEKSEDLHRHILKEAASIFDLVLAIDFKVNLKASNIYFFKREKVDSYLKEYLDEDVLIFFKGSRSVKMENIIENLT
jgi:UDP-N-acetylmuramyl pentapeptide synthase